MRKRKPRQYNDDDNKILSYKTYGGGYEAANRRQVNSKSSNFGDLLVEWKREKSTVCVCVRERERERKRKGGRETFS